MTHDQTLRLSKIVQQLTGAGLLLGDLTNELDYHEGSAVVNQYSKILDATLMLHEIVKEQSKQYIQNG